MAHNENTLVEDLEQLLAQAFKKTSASEEKELCRYLPGANGGYMHHFTLRKLKKNDPQHLISLLKKFVLSTETPRKFEPKTRAPRGSRGKNDLLSFTRSEIEKILEIAVNAGDKEVIARFSPKRSLPALKRELIRSIRDHRVKPELWSAYCEAVS